MFLNINIEICNNYKYIISMVAIYFKKEKKHF